MFPYEDTDGEPIPEIPCHRLERGDPLGRYTQLSTVAHSLGYMVIEENLPGTRNGDCTFAHAARAMFAQDRGEARRED